METDSASFLPAGAKEHVLAPPWGIILPGKDPVMSINLSFKHTPIFTVADFNYCFVTREHQGTFRIS